MAPGYYKFLLIEITDANPCRSAILTMCLEDGGADNGGIIPNEKLDHTFTAEVKLTRYCWLVHAPTFLFLWRNPEGDLAADMILLKIWVLLVGACDHILVAEMSTQL